MIKTVEIDKRDILDKLRSENSDLHFIKYYINDNYIETLDIENPSCESDYITFLNLLNDDYKKIEYGCNYIELIKANSFTIKFEASSLLYTNKNITKLKATELMDKWLLNKKCKKVYFGIVEIEFKQYLDEKSQQIYIEKEYSISEKIEIKSNEKSLLDNKCNCFIDEAYKAQYIPIEVTKDEIIMLSSKNSKPAIYRISNKPIEYFDAKQYTF